MARFVIATILVSILASPVVLGQDVDLPVHPRWVTESSDHSDSEAGEEQEKIETGTIAFDGPSFDKDEAPKQDSDPNPSDAPVEFYGERLPSESGSVVYVIDRSSSMMIEDVSGKGIRINIAKAEAARSIRGLSVNFSFNIIMFNHKLDLWQRDLKKANDTNKELAIAWLKTFRFDGDTATAPAVVAAIKTWPKNLLIVLLTDGEPTSGLVDNSPLEHRRIIRENNSQRAQINVFGILPKRKVGIEDRDEESLRRFCQGVASDSGGSFYDVNN